ncbi:hypothetical protein WUBG_03738 [Wuchereria bancrofti]|uniref:Uncharacterized protein n=1 Tax=Wuchereria bancrofti TaxID=6293 RepID=J9ET40_WUCBA|nr:hypothetical protein WUBG_03738 [Wuchereria bancrofti]
MAKVVIILTLVVVLLENPGTCLGRRVLFYELISKKANLHQKARINVPSLLHRTNQTYSKRLLIRKKRNGRNYPEELMNYPKNYNDSALIISSIQNRLSP